MDVKEVYNICMYNEILKKFFDKKFVELLYNTYTTNLNKKNKLYQTYRTGKTTLFTK